MAYSLVKKTSFPMSLLRCQFNMSMNFFLLLLYTFKRKAGANIKPFFLSHNTFLKFLLKKKFTPFFNTISKHILELLQNNLSRFERANIQPLFPYNQNFFKLFFYRFLTQTPNSLKHKIIRYKKSFRSLR